MARQLDPPIPHQQGPQNIVGAAPPSTALRGLREVFDIHREAEIYRSQPGLGPVLAVPALAEFGDDPDR
jgi:hypothetical protein